MDREIDVERLWRGWGRAPYHRFLNMQLESWDRASGEFRFKVPFSQGFKRHAAEPGLHGGVLASIVDVAADFALSVASGRFGLPTIDLRVDYLRTTGDETLTALARVVKAGRRIGVADVEVSDTQGRLCVVGRGTYAMHES